MSMFSKMAASVKAPMALGPQKATPTKENSEQIAKMKADQASAKLNTMGASRSPDEIRESGVLDAFARLEGVEVPKSEYDRTVEDDSIIVQKGLGKLTVEQIDEMKKKAIKHPEVERDLQEAMASKHYGSARHRQYAELIQELSGGVISVEEAMAMNPSGGIPGAGMKEIPGFGSIDPIARHAMRHDATGFMLTRFGVGPGYGSQTTPFGLDKDNPMAGQVLGILRETFNPSDLPGADGRATAGPLAGLGVGKTAVDGVKSATGAVGGAAQSAGSVVGGAAKCAGSGLGGLFGSAGSKLGAASKPALSVGSAAKSAGSKVSSVASSAKKKLGGLFG